MIAKPMQAMITYYGDPHLVDRGLRVQQAHLFLRNQCLVLSFSLLADHGQIVEDILPSFRPTVTPSLASHQDINIGPMLSQNG